jgi:solute carrier family 10 (sodium/bile acid cotransporter), member 7
MRSFLGKHWFVILLGAGLGAALAWPPIMERATVYWEPSIAVAVSLFLISWTMPTRFLVAELRHPLASIWAVFLSYGVVPLAATLLGLLAPNPDVGIGLILVSSVPCTLSSAVLWTRMAGGNEATALLTVMGTTFSSWILTTCLLLALTGTAPDLDVASMVFDLVVSLILPVIVGQTLRLNAASVRFAERHRLTLGVVSQILILAIVLKAGVAVGERLHEAAAWEVPSIFLWSIVLAVGLHLFALASGLVTGRWLRFDRGRRIAIGFAASQKTLPVSLMLYEKFFREKYPYAVMPLLCYHVGQLLLDTIIARQLLKDSPAGNTREG